MPEIKVKITQDSSEFSNKTFQVSSNNLYDFMTTLAKVKEDTNTELTKIVEASKCKTKTRDENEEEESSESSEDEENAKKKGKIKN
jgi:hypothetical protein